MKAVDSEYKKNLQMDGRRLYALLKSICDPKHAFAKFDIGNLTSLRDLPAQQNIVTLEELKKFYAAHYSANLMKLVILGREPLDTLEQWAKEKCLF
jgi:insulysin